MWRPSGWGSTLAFAVACSAILIWALTGPFFQFGDTWQLIVNASTTIFTFLMLFLVQRTQNRDGAAIQLKLDELIRVSTARNVLLDLEEMEEEKLEEFRKPFRELAKRAAEEAENERSTREGMQDPYARRRRF